MFIKQIIIQGFKSYKEQTVIEPFSPKTNVIVGRNGSGKSNFFAAIRFVLSDAYTQMGREERQALLHEGSGSAVMSAYVEIIFDNSDDRFPTGKDELILRRTIGLKKDEYSLDRKNATKTDVMNLLESAGFSRSNPYYIVPQGRVTTLTNMKDAERLNLLKEVAGTQVYESRRSDSLKIMVETDNKRSKIDETLVYIKERLGELEEEMKELREYQEKDKERRCLEYAFYHREQTTLQDNINAIDQLREDVIGDSNDNQQEFDDAQRHIMELDDEAKQLRRQMEVLKAERRTLEEDRRDAVKAQAKSELNVKTLADGQSSSEEARIRHEKELKAVKQDIQSKEAELAKILPEFNKRKGEETAARQSLDAASSARQHLYNKQGRGAQYKSKAARDEALKQEIQELNTALGEQKAIRMDAGEQVKNVQTEIKALEGQTAGLRQKLEGWNRNRQALSDEVAAAKASLEKLDDERKVLRREDDKLDSVKENARAESARAEKELSYTMDGATSRGLATVRRLKREHNIDGAYGTLAELLDCEEIYRTAVEQTAGNSLFHYVVDNADTATELANALYNQKGGRVTFMPLSQLKSKPAKLPKANDATPLLQKIHFDQKFKVAMEQVFGKTVVCPSLPIASQYARSHGCNAITPEGDTTNKKGAMTGGYIDPRKSRLEAVRAVNKWRDEYESLKHQSDQIKRKMEGKDQEVTEARSELQKLEQKHTHFASTHEPLKMELRNSEVYLQKLRDQLDASLQQKENVENLLREHGDNIGKLEAEMSSDFKKTLTADEEHQLEKLNTETQSLQQQWNDASSKRRELESRKKRLEVELRESLRPKLDNLNSQDIDTQASGSSGNLKEAQRELKRAQKAVASAETKLKDCETQLEEAESKTAGLEKERSQRIERHEELARVIEKQRKRMEKSIGHKTLLTARLVECTKTIRDLGVLPDEAFEKYSNTESAKIQSKLKKVTEALKKYVGVNKKAFEQYNNFKTQQDTLAKRSKELTDSQASINELIDALDQRKDEAIERTFKQVSKEFASIFERLVPAGRGRLVIQRKTDQRARDDSDDDDEARQSVENYTGVGISVSFNSKHDEQQRIQQLSGGQKSLCALALVFAIQQCDPAPFYLFDEIDANLDAQYRTAVAQMLQEISAQQNEGQDGEGGMSGQFICTTFRPEMLLVADKCYGVTFHNKTSGIDAVSREEALRFVDGEAPK